MTNAEKHKEAIIAQMCETGKWAVDRTGKIMSCDWDNCAVCTFSTVCTFSITNNYCWNEKKKWLNAEADEKKVFSEKDKEVIRALDKVQWVARDKDGKVFGYCAKPIKLDGAWMHSEGRFVNLTPFTTTEFAPVKWEDDKPTNRAEILGEEE